MSAVAMTVAKTWNAGVMSSLRGDWATPKQLFEMLNREFHFTLDVCADESNAKVGNFLTESQNSFNYRWTGICWMNPPYGRNIGKWIQKAHEEAKHGATVVCLLPARTDTAWWHDYCMKGEIRLLRGRLYFNDTPNGRAPFPSALVIFRPTGATT